MGSMRERSPRQYEAIVRSTNVPTNIWHPAYLATISAVVALALTWSCGQPATASQSSASTPNSQPPPGNSPATNNGSHAVLPPFVPAEDGQWSMAPKDYASSRFSGLDEINRG